MVVLDTGLPLPWISPRAMPQSGLLMPALRFPHVEEVYSTVGNRIDCWEPPTGGQGPTRAFHPGYQGRQPLTNIAKLGSGDRHGATTCKTTCKGEGSPGRLALPLFWQLRRDRRIPRGIMLGGAPRHPSSALYFFPRLRCRFWDNRTLTAQYCHQRLWVCVSKYSGVRRSSETDSDSQKCPGLVQSASVLSNTKTRCTVAFE
jgi:hypothetical protein